MTDKTNAAETVPEMARNAVRIQAEARKANFLTRYKDELALCESEADIMALFEAAYDELYLGEVP